MKFSLRTLLIAITAMAVVLSFWGWRYRSVQIPLDAIRKSGVRLYHGNDTDGVLRSLSEWCWPTNVSVDVVVDAQPQVWKYIAEFRSLEELRIAESQSDDRVWQEAAKLTSVNRVDAEAQGPPVLKLLAELHGLKELSLTTSHWKTGDLDSILHHEDLRVLNLSHSTVTDQDLETICRLKNLEELYLIGTSITDAGVDQLLKLSNLRVLNLNETDISGESVGRFAELDSLTKLGIRVVGLPRDTTKLCKPLSHLDLLEIDLPWIFLEEDGTPELQSVFPKCKIHWGSGRVRIGNE